MSGYDVEYGYGYEEEEEGGPIIEKTSSSPSHYELMAIFKALSMGLGISDDEEAKPFLSQIMDQLSAIQDILEKSHAASEAIRAEAQVILEAHEKSANEYMKQLDLEKPIDPYPFIAVPPGTSVKEVPDGGRLFALPDGNHVQANPDLKIQFIGKDGQIQSVPIEDDGKVPLPNSYVLLIDIEAVKTSQDAAGIEGLPSDAKITQLNDRKSRVELVDGLRIEVSYPDRMAIVINTSGNIDLLSIDRIEGIGETIDVRLISGGAKGFSCQESKHQGMIEANGTIHLSLATGKDLIIRFAEESDPGTGDQDDSVPNHFYCEEHE